MICSLPGLETEQLKRFGKGVVVVAMVVVVVVGRVVETVDGSAVVVELEVVLTVVGLAVALVVVAV
jgi:hypothetical protein